MKGYYKFNISMKERLFKFCLLANSLDAKPHLRPRFKRSHTLNSSSITFLYNMKL